MFTTLADDGVIHALQQTEVSTVITSEELMPRCRDVLKKVPGVTKLVYMEKPKFSNWKPETWDVPNVKVHSYGELLNAGAEMALVPEG